MAKSDPSGACRLCHTVLFIMRCFAAYGTRFWRRSRWTIPTGQLTFEFTIKLLSQEQIQVPGTQQTAPHDAQTQAA